MRGGETRLVLTEDQYHELVNCIQIIRSSCETLIRSSEDLSVINSAGRMNRTLDRIAAIVTSKT